MNAKILLRKSIKRGAQLGFLGMVVAVVTLYLIAGMLRFQQLMALSAEEFAFLESIRLPAWLLAGYQLFVEALPGIVFLIMGALLFWRKPSDRMGLFTAFTLLTLGTTLNTNLYFIPEERVGLVAVVDLFALLAGGFFFVFMYIFPDGRFIPRWMIFVPVAFIVSFCLGIFIPLINIANWSDTVGAIYVGVWLSTGVLAQAYRFRYVSNPIQRQQTKWVAYSLAATMIMAFISLWLDEALPPLFGSGPFDLAINLSVQLVVSFVWLIFPLSIAFSILRYRLWDIDTLINRTLVYTLLTAMLVGAYFGFVIVLQYLFRNFVGSSRSEMITVLSTLGIASLFIPLRRGVQTVIDRRFYRQKYDAEKSMAVFRASLRNEVNLNQLSDRLLSVVQETMQPAHLSLWVISQKKPSSDE